MANKKNKEGAAEMSEADKWREENGAPPVAVATEGEQNGKPAKPAESKAERFKRLANRRVPKLLKLVAQVTNLSNRAQYEYTPDQCEKLLARVFAAVDELQAKFRGAAVKEDSAPLF